MEIFYGVCILFIIYTMVCIVFIEIHLKGCERREREACVQERIEASPEQKLSKQKDKEEQVKCMFKEKYSFEE